jgi:hypothetical protein
MGLEDTGVLVPPAAAMGGGPTSLARGARGAGLKGWEPGAAAKLAGPKARSTTLGASLRRPQARPMGTALGASGDEPGRLGIG